MPSTYSSLLRLELMATGEKSATWGDITNTNLGTLLEKSIAGTATVSVTAGNVTLTALNGTDDESRCAVISVTGTPGVSRNVVAPSSSKTYCVINGSNAAIVFKGAATSGVTLAAGERSWVCWNGSDFVRIGVATDSPTFTGTVTVAALTASGNVTLGDAVADTLSVGGSTVKNGSGNWSFAAPSSGTTLALASASGAVGLSLSSAAASDVQFSMAAVSFARDWRLKVMNADGSFRLRDETGGLDRLQIPIGSAATFYASGNEALVAKTTSPTGATVFRVNTSADLGLAVVAYGPSYASGSLFNVGASGVTLTQGAVAPLAVGTTGASALTLGTNSLERVIINSAGNVGIGVSPPAGWRVGAAALQVGIFATLHTASNGATALGFGLYESGTNTYSYSTTGDTPALYQLITGSHIWSQATGSGTVGGAVTLSEQMRLNGTGLGVGVYPTVRFQVAADSAASGRIAIFSNSGSTGAGIQLSQTGVDAFDVRMPAGSPDLAFFSSGTTERARVTSSGLILLERASDSGLGIFQAQSGGAQVADFLGTGGGYINVRAPAAGIAGVRVGGNGLTVGGASLDFQQDASGNADILNRSNTRLSLYTNGTEYQRITNVGQVQFQGIHNNASGASGTTPMIASGTYTPTITQGINCSGGSPAVNGSFKWYRVGNVVHLSGWLSSTGGFTAGNTYTELLLSLPIASNFTAQSDATGMSAFSNSANNTGQGDYVYADTGGDRLVATFYPNTTSGAFLFVEATYEVK